MPSSSLWQRSNFRLVMSKVLDKVHMGMHEVRQRSLWKKVRNKLSKVRAALR